MSPGREAASGVARAVAKHTAPIPRRALRWPDEVASALGVSDDFLRKHGLIAELRVVRIGSLRFVPIAELDAWLDRRALLPLGGDHGR